MSWEALESFNRGENELTFLRGHFALGEQTEGTNEDKENNFMALDQSCSSEVVRSAWLLNMLVVKPTRYPEDWIWSMRLSEESVMFWGLIWTTRKNGVAIY